MRECKKQTKFTSKPKNFTMSLQGERGFTMIEVIFAIFIVLVGSLGSYIIIQSLLASIYQSSLRLTAAYLAQEGVEIVRNIRDENWLNNRGWRTGLAQGSWEADYTSASLADSYDGDYLNIDSNGFYSYRTRSNPTKFIRKITISYQGNDRLSVSVNVYWNYKGTVKGPVIVEEVLYKWYQ